MRCRTPCDTIAYACAGERLATITRVSACYSERPVTITIVSACAGYCSPRMNALIRSESQARVFLPTLLPTLLLKVLLPTLVWLRLLLLIH